MKPFEFRAKTARLGATSSNASSKTLAPEAGALDVRDRQVLSSLCFSTI